MDKTCDFLPANSTRQNFVQKELCNCKISIINLRQSVSFRQVNEAIIGSPHFFPSPKDHFLISTVTKTLFLPRFCFFFFSCGRKNLVPVPPTWSEAEVPLYVLKYKFLRELCLLLNLVHRILLWFLEVKL